jgi:prophage regulatory protein
MSNQNNTHPRIERLSEVIPRTGLSRSTIYNLINEGSFPTKIKLGARAIGFLEADIDAWILSKVAGALL